MIYCETCGNTTETGLTCGAQERLTYLSRPAKYILMEALGDFVANAREFPVAYRARQWPMLPVHSAPYQKVVDATTWDAQRRERDGE